MVADNPEFGEAAFSLGLLLAELRDDPRALDSLRNADRLMPDYARAHYNLGQLVDFQGMDAEAARALERAVALAPHDPTYLGALADFYLRRDRVDDVQRVLGIVEIHHPNSALHQQVRRALSRIQRRAGGPE